MAKEMAMERSIRATLDFSVALAARFFHRFAILLPSNGQKGKLFFFKSCGGSYFHHDDDIAD